MINLYLRRYEYQPERTFGKLYVEGTDFCDVLEDTHRDLNKVEKVYGKTCIPSGRYKVIFTYSPKFKKRMPLLVGVPHFEGVRIHTGNTEKDTEGCLLVGIREGNTLVKSRITFERLMRMIENETDITIDIHSANVV